VPLTGSPMRAGSGRAGRCDGGVRTWQLGAAAGARDRQRAFKGGDGLSDLHCTCKESPLRTDLGTSVGRVEEASSMRSLQYFG
jgi:hypothetical protein